MQSIIFEGDTNCKHEYEKQNLNQKGTHKIITCMKCKRKLEIDSSD